MIVEKSFDFMTLCKLVMARNWSKLSPEQQKEFAAEFKEHLTITYGKNVENYRNEKVVITGDREEARGDWTVKSIIERPTAENVKVDYRLRRIDGQWRIDGRADLGRVERQQDFVNAALQEALDRVARNPLEAADVFESTTGVLRLDDDLDPFAAAGALREAVGDGLTTYSLPVKGAEIDGKAVLQLADGAGEVLAYFRGEGPPPAET